MIASGMTTTMKMRMFTLVSMLAIALSATHAGATTLTIGDAMYLGSVNDGIPSNLTDEMNYINILITLAPGQDDTQLPPGTGEIYNRENSLLVGPFPTATLSGAVKVDTQEDEGNTGINVTGFTYILAKYDAGNAGSLVWLLDDSVQTVDIPLKYNNRGLSHYATFNGTAVPDGGVTIGLLGFVMLGLGYLRRRMA